MQNLTNLKNQANSLFGLKITRSYIEGELFFMISENIRLTRSIMTRLMGVATQEKIFKLHERFNNLGLNDREMSFLMPTIITNSSKNFKINSFIL